MTLFDSKNKDLEQIKNFSITTLRKDVGECSENTPIDAAYAMMRLVEAYKADIKFTKDPLFSEIDKLVVQFKENCACNKIGRFKGQEELKFKY